MRIAARRLWMGLSTLMGRPKGFFSPYRYAGSVAPTTYPELEAHFRAAEPAFREVLEGVAAHRDRLATFNGPPPVPRWDQYWFPRLDGAAAYAIIRAARPRRIVEVGSGHSTRMLAQAAADAAAGGEGAEITCIDPAPRAALRGLPVSWREQVLGEADLPLFAGLEAGDIAFFDSSHLLWPGTDVDLIVNRIMPALAPGVLIHLHDISLPDAYPPAWGWRGYTEQLGLGGWIAGQGVDLVFSSHYALIRMKAAEVAAPLPLPDGALETSLWLRRTGGN
ncbi:class I SAM-dependent methyltransferase [Rhodobacteraceae bacterium NNCM2]|nr:class I SAM-dependent methyltransferase [Coraliihabitans acroporae]